MKNKILIKLIVPEIDNAFDLFVPTNELVWKLKKMICKSVSDLTGNSLDLKKEYVLIDKTTSNVISNNVSLYNTNVRNAHELILIQEKNNIPNVINKI